MRMAIMGSGGVGAYVGSRLQAAGEDVVFIARGAHLAALQKDGLRLESPVHPLHLPTVKAVQEPSMVGPVDLITPHVGGAKVRGGVMYVSAVIERPGVIRSPGGLRCMRTESLRSRVIPLAPWRRWLPWFASKLFNFSTVKSHHEPSPRTHRR